MGGGRGAYRSPSVTAPPTAPPLPPQKKKTPAAKFTSQGDAHVRTNAQIKFLYYPLNGTCFRMLHKIIILQK